MESERLALAGFDDGSLAASLATINREGAGRKTYV